jgi:Fic family protein
MRIEDFTEERTGKLVRIVEGTWAFVPDPLPPNWFDMSWELARLNSQADRALSELAGLARTLPNAHLFSGPFRRREAVLSSRIEGTQATMAELFLFEMGAPVNGKTSEVLEVVNYVKALDYGLNRLKELPICKRLIREIHAQLMAGVRGEDKTPGEFRRRQNYIGPPGCKLENATYIPPPVSEMQTALDDLDHYMNKASPFPPLIRQALIHYQFEAIHPFLDGNGRIGRLLLTLMLYAEGIIPYPLLYLSDYIERHKSEYYRLLLAVSQRGAWSEWAAFFLRGVAERSLDAIKRANTLHHLMQEYRRKLESTSSSVLPLRLLNELFKLPLLSTTEATRILNVTTPTALKTIGKLVKQGILKELETGRQRNKIYIAPEIHRIVTEE